MLYSLKIFLLAAISLIIYILPAEEHESMTEDPATIYDSDSILVVLFIAFIGVLFSAIISWKEFKKYQRNKFLTKIKSGLPFIFFLLSILRFIQLIFLYQG